MAIFNSKLLVYQRVTIEYSTAVMKNRRKTMEDPGFCPRSQLTSAGLKVAKADFLSLASLTLVQDWCLLMDNRSIPQHSHELGYIH